jgi:hypothetical protein
MDLVARQKFDAFGWQLARGPVRRWACSFVYPKANASACARQLALASSACAGLSQEDCAGSRKSSAARGVPWCSIWKKECCALLPGSPPITGAGLVTRRFPPAEVH